MGDALVVGVGMTRFAKHVDRSTASLAHEAVAAALADAGVSAQEVEMVFFANALSGIVTGQETIRGQVALAGSGLDGAPIVNVDNACAAGGTAVHLAQLAVSSGRCDLALAIGAEKLYHEDPARPLRAMLTGVDVEQLPALQAAFTRPDAGARSFMLDLYADVAIEYLSATGATERSLAAVASKDHHHGSLNPNAQHRKRFSVEEVLASRRVCGPFTVPMCSPFGDGASAVLVASSERAARLAAAEPVEILASELTSGGLLDAGRPRLDAMLATGAVPRAARRAYEAAGLGPADLDLVEVHDATSSAELIISEQLQLCASGEAAALAESGDTALGGRIPINVSGGLVSKGHPVGATGCAQVTEIVTHLRGRAGERQVEGARVGLAENAGGRLHPDDAAAVVTILRRREPRATARVPTPVA
ncbi:MAG TPA: thiolase family protein [Capillimicrobium sp.]